MRILYICLDRGIPLGGTKGASIHVAEMLSAFEAEGHETAVVARCVASAQARRVFEASAAEGLGWVPGRYLRRDARELAAGPTFRGSVRRAMVEFRPDLVYERYSLFRGEGRAESRRASLPLVLEVNAPLVEEERRFRGLALGPAGRRIERRVWREADLVVVPSGPLRRRVRAVGQERVLVVPNAVDVAVFSPSPRGAEVRSRLGLDGRFVVAFAGSLKGWHDLESVVEAVARLPKKRMASLLVVGDGPERPSLEARAESLGVDVRFTGAVPHCEVPVHLAAADAGVASLPPDPALDYFSPLKAMEYLACGLPIVVAEAGDLGSLAEAGVALAYRPGDPGDLAANLEMLASDSSLRERLAATGPPFAASRTWRAAARQVLQAVESLSRTASTA